MIRVGGIGTPQSAPSGKSAGLNKKIHFYKKGLDKKESGRADCDAAG
jgi:hypothetical protein